MCAAVSQSHRLCSMSTVSQSRPLRAMKRAGSDAAEGQPGTERGLAGAEGLFDGIGSHELFTLFQDFERLVLACR